MTQKVVGLILIALSTLGIGSMIHKEWFTTVSITTNREQEASAPPVELNPIALHILQDIKTLDEKGYLSKQWKNIAEVEYKYNSELQKSILPEKFLDTLRHPKGHYRMEVEIIDLPNPEKTTLILQMSLLNIKTGNKVSEIGRTYDFTQFMKKEKSKD